MINELDTFYMRDVVQSHIRRIFLNNSKKLRQPIYDIVSIAKHKRPKKFASDIDCFKKYDIFELGFISNVYKVHVAFDINNTDNFFLFGYLDANSCYPIIVSSIEIDNTNENIKNFLSSGKLALEENRYDNYFNGISRLLIVVENINPLTNQNLI